MKKIYALAAIVLATTAFGQRTIDGTLALTTPVDGDTVAQSASQSIVFTISNSGDTLTAGDTLALYYFNMTTSVAYSLTQVQGQTSIVPVNAQIAQIFNSGSISSNQLQQGGLTLNTTAAGFNVGDKIAVVFEIWGKNGEQEADADFADNIGTFVLKAAPVSVSDLSSASFSAYPNPAISELTITGSEEVVSISVLTLDGKTISSTKGNVVNVSTLANGTYFYEATTVSGAKTVNKFVKQ